MFFLTICRIFGRNNFMEVGKAALDGLVGAKHASWQLCDDLHHAKKEANQPGHVQGASAGGQVEDAEQELLQGELEQLIKRLAVDAALLAEWSCSGGIIGWLICT
jgi:hypothetical protein